jgi:hypothetical protein
MADLNNASGMSAISIEEQASDPAALTGYWKLFPKSGGIYAISPAGTVVGPFATVGGTGAAPGDAKYVVQTADADLPNAQALGALTTGLLKNTTTTGVLSIAAAADLPAHASRHQSGGADAIKLDDLAAPDDNTDLDATTSAHGLLPKLGGGTTNYLRADGTWAAPAGTAGSTVDVEDEGTPEGAADTIDFTGAGVSVTFAAGKATVDIPGGGGSAPDLIILRDEKTSGTAGGTFTAGAWQTRTLNTEVTDAGGHCTLASNEFTLAAGTYELYAHAPASVVGAHQARLYNVTDAAVVTGGEGSNEYEGVGTASTRSVISVRFTLASSKALRIEHRGAVTKTTTGFGAACSFGTEIYTVVVIHKVG